MTHAWKPSTLLEDLQAVVTPNVRLGDGRIARVWSHAGYWFITIVDKDGPNVSDPHEFAGLSISKVCRWLRANDAERLGK